jgi:hypothetical protein
MQGSSSYSTVPSLYGFLSAMSSVLHSKKNVIHYIIINIVRYLIADHVLEFRLFLKY